MRILPFRVALVAVVVTAAGAGTAAAQQPSLENVLSFLLTNRTVVSGSFAGDQQAAEAMRDAITSLLLEELSTVPVGSPASGFTYRLDPELGTSIRSSRSFGPTFTERSLTAGDRSTTFGVRYREVAFDTLDGASLRDGRLIAIASRIAGDADPFDVETLRLRLKARLLTVSGLIGLTDRLDLGVVVPLIRLELVGERVDTYRGLSVVQATADASATGTGDVVTRAKYNAIRFDHGGIAVAGDVRIPTGSRGNLLGGDETTITPRFIASFERWRLGLTADAGYAFRSSSQRTEFNAAVTAAPGSRLTLVVEVVGRHLGAGSRLANTVAPNPDLTGVETVRLTAVDAATTRVALAGSVRWNPSGAWVVSAGALRPVTTTGLSSRWTVSISVDYSVGR